MPIGANLNVSNLPTENNPRALFEELFKKFSTIKNLISIRISISQNSKTQGHAYIQFESKTSADEALNAFNNKDISGHAIRVEAYKN